MLISYLIYIWNDEKIFGFYWNQRFLITSTFKPINFPKVNSIRRFENFDCMFFIYWSGISDTDLFHLTNVEINDFSCWIIPTEMRHLSVKRDKNCGSCDKICEIMSSDSSVFIGLRFRKVSEKTNSAIFLRVQILFSIIGIFLSWIILIISFFNRTVGTMKNVKSNRTSEIKFSSD